MPRAASVATGGELVALLDCLEALVEGLVRYTGDVVQAGALEHLQTACWDLEEVCPLSRVPCAPCGASAAQEWLLAFQGYSSAGAMAGAAVKGAGWRWARGVAGDHRAAPEAALDQLHLAAVALLDATVRLARVGARVADEGAQAASRDHGELAPRFAAVRTTATAAADLASVGRENNGSKLALGAGEC